MVNILNRNGIETRAIEHPSNGLYFKERNNKITARWKERKGLFIFILLSSLRSCSLVTLSLAKACYR